MNLKQTVAEEGAELFHISLFSNQQTQTQSRNHVYILRENITNHKMIQLQYCMMNIICFGIILQNFPKVTSIFFALGNFVCFEEVKFQN